MGLHSLSYSLGIRPDEANEMSLHTDLLKQATILATREPRRPFQASLRRAASAAYYALFHLLVEEGTRLMLSGTKRKPL